MWMRSFSVYVSIVDSNEPPLSSTQTPCFPNWLLKVPIQTYSNQAVSHNANHEAIILFLCYIPMLEDWHRHDIPLLLFRSFSQPKLILISFSCTRPNLTRTISWSRLVEKYGVIFPLYSLYIPFIFPIQWEARELFGELFGVSQPSNSLLNIIRYHQHN